MTKAQARKFLEIQSNLDKECKKLSTLLGKLSDETLDDYADIVSDLGYLLDMIEDGLDAVRYRIDELKDITKGDKR